jgi:hypothetical protein
VHQAACSASSNAIGKMKAVDGMIGDPQSFQDITQQRKTGGRPAYCRRNERPLPQMLCSLIVLVRALALR